MGWNGRGGFVWLGRAMIDLLDIQINDFEHIYGW